MPKECDTPLGEVAPPADFAVANKSSTKKLTASFTDTLPSAMEAANPTGFATYVVEALNAAGRGAGISNLAHVPLAIDYAKSEEAKQLLNVNDKYLR